jgi:hypothetical protein
MTVFIVFPFAVLSDPLIASTPSKHRETCPRYHHAPECLHNPLPDESQCTVVSFQVE